MVDKADIPATLEFKRDDNLEVDPLSQALHVDYVQVAPDPELRIEVVMGMVDNEAALVFSVLEKGRLVPEHYRVTVTNLMHLLVQGRPQMRKEEEPSGETVTDGGLILPPGVDS